MNYYKYHKKRNEIQRGFSFSAVVWLIALNIAISIVGFLFLLGNEKTVSLVALNPLNISQGKNLWAIFTHMFFHANGFHLFVNMFSLYFLGNLTEKIIGKKRFVWFYLAAGVFAGLFTVILSLTLGTNELGAQVIGSPEAFMIGASGAIFGILGLLAVLIPRSKVYLIAGPLIMIILQFVLGAIFPQFEQSINTITTAILFVMIMLMVFPSERLRRLALPVEIRMWTVPIFAIVPLVIVTFFIQLPIGNVAHFGGFLAGVIFGFYLRKKYQNKVARLQKMFR